MKLGKIVQSISQNIGSAADIEITGIAYDSRAVKPGYLFVAIRGFETDGHKYIKSAVRNGAAAVIGTTGHTEEEKALIFAAAKEIPVFYSGNMSLGIAVLCRLAKDAARYFPDADIEIVEAHHNRKVDAPSGTALMLLGAIKEVRPNAWANCGRSGEGKRTKEEIGISALRMGSVVGMHEVILHTGTQQLTLRHEAVTRAMLADGAVDAARFLLGKPAGLYNMESILNQ